MNLPQRALWIAKLKASAAQLAIGIAVFAAVIVALLLSWYPEPYFSVDGGRFVLTYAALVDFGIGALLTLVLYTPQRARARVMLVTIAAARLVALSTALYLLHEHKPLYAAFVGYPRYEFFPVTGEMIAHAPPLPAALREAARMRPALAFIDLPADHAETRRMLISGATGGESVFARTDLYRPLEGTWRARAMAFGRHEQRIEASYPGNLARVRAFAAVHGGAFDDFAFVPLNARYGRALLAFRRPNGGFVGAIRLIDRDRP
jgi:hypothetical protein